MGGIDGNGGGGAGCVIDDSRCGQYGHTLKSGTWKMCIPLLRVRRIK